MIEIQSASKGSRVGRCELGKRFALVGVMSIGTLLVGCATVDSPNRIAARSRELPKLDSRVRMAQALVPGARGLCGNPALNQSPDRGDPELIVCRLQGFAETPMPVSSYSSGNRPPELTAQSFESPMGPVQPNVYFPIEERGPLNVVDDILDLPGRFGEDMKALITPENAVFLGLSGVGAVVLRNNVDPRVNHDTDLHGPRWNNTSDFLSHGGDTFLVHIPLLSAMYATSLWHQDEELHELTLTLFTGIKFSIYASLILQYATGTHRSDGGITNFFKDNGFPSEATASSFALAAIVDEKFGWRGGLPAYLVAGLIGWSEVDQHQHTVSDVVFGAALGYAIGKSIGALQYHPDAPFKLVPFMEPNSGTQGIGIQYVY